MKETITRRSFLKKSVVSSIGLGLLSTNSFAKASSIETSELTNVKQEQKTEIIQESKKLNVGIFLYPNMTMLDAYGPLQVLALVSELNTFTFAKTSAALPCDAKIDLLPNYGFDDCPPVDILIVPGAANPINQIQDTVVLQFLRGIGKNAKYITSVCTGALILAETGLLDAYKSTVHWAYAEALKAYLKVSYVDSRC